ncbi:MAG: GTPase Era, partial [Deltaproteobacteria bacterium]|nr:GTPase Era [Deltaproteobacteria bacterium]
MVEATDPMNDGDDFIIGNLKHISAPVVLAINKIDKVSRDRLLPMIDSYSKVFAFKEIVLISATRSDGIDRVLELLTETLPEGPEYFPREMVTDQPERFLAAEIVREKVFHVTSEEIPYSVAVTVEEFNERLGKGAKPIIDIRAIINVERDSQKGIVIGKKGVMLKKIGTAAREELEAILGVKVFLEIHVKVTKGWTRNARAMEEFGYK